MCACVHACHNNFLKNTATLEQGFEGSKSISHMTILAKSMARRGESMSKGFGKQERSQSRSRRGVIGVRMGEMMSN